MKTNPDFLPRCDCIPKLQQQLAKNNYHILPFAAKPGVHPSIPGLLTVSLLLQASGRPPASALIEFNFCPFCGLALRQKLKGGNEDGKKANDPSSSGSPVA